MAEESTAQEATPSRPASPHDPPTDERNDEAAGDESAPLLQTEASDGHRMARFTQSQFIHFLTSLALSSAVLALVLVIVTSIVSSIVPYGYQIPYMTRDAMTAVVVPALFSIFICAANLARIRRNRPLLPLALNLLIDLLIAVFTIPYAAGGMSCVAESYWSWNHLSLRILAGIAMGMAIIFGVVHAILFFIRCRIAFLMESWRKPIVISKRSAFFRIFHQVLWRTSAAEAGWARDCVIRRLKD